MLILTPEACPRDPRGFLQDLDNAVDVIQVRPKPRGSSRAPAPARATLDLARLTLEVVGVGAHAPLVLVDDRVDVAHVLWSEGLAGVHLGQDDTPPRIARELLGPDALIGLSTHSLEQVLLAEDEPIDYLGFGPIGATTTKGYERGLGPELAWVASASSPRLLFPIGGIDSTNADTLAEVGRAVVGAAILAAKDPAAAARGIRAALGDTYGCA